MSSRFLYITRRPKRGCNALVSYTVYWYVLCGMHSWVEAHTIDKCPITRLYHAKNGPLSRYLWLCQTPLYNFEHPWLSRLFFLFALLVCSLHRYAGLVVQGELSQLLFKPMCLVCFFKPSAVQETRWTIWIREQGCVSVILGSSSCAVRSHPSVLLEETPFVLLTFSFTSIMSGIFELFARKWWMI